MKDEIKALEENGTWKMEDFPPDKKVIGCNWVYKLKFNSDGSFEIYKAPLVVLSNNQTEVVDYDEIFAHVAKMVTIRSFLEVDVSRDWEVHQMDVNNMFLHVYLDEEMYMCLSPGFRTNDTNKVCRLPKFLYGLHQTPRCWFAKLNAALKDYGFHQSIKYYSLFTLDRQGTHLHALVYVDDLIITSSSSQVIQELKTYLSNYFHMKDLGVLKYFLGVEVARSLSGLYLCQRKYTLDIISEAGLMGAKPTSFPLEQNHKLELAKAKPLPNPSRFIA